MIAGNAGNSDSFKVTAPPSSQEILLTRLFDAMTKPEHVKRGGAASAKATLCRSARSTFYGEYREITPPSRLVFTEIFEQFPDSVSVVTADFTEEDGRTRLTTTVRYPSPEVRDMVLRSGMAHGAGISYDRLEDLLASGVF